MLTTPDPSRSRPSRRRLVAFRTLTILAILAFTLGSIRLLGSAIRRSQDTYVAFAGESAPIYLPPSECTRRYGYPPGLSRCLDRAGEHTNGAGAEGAAGGFLYRLTEPIVPKPAGLYRVVALGESTTANRWPSYLETLLRERWAGAGSAEVINAAIPGYTVSDLRIRYQHDIEPLTPDLLIVYAGWNDLSSCSVFDSTESAFFRDWLRDASPLEAAPREWMRRNPAWLADRRQIARRVRAENAAALPAVPAEGPPTDWTLSRDLEAIRRAAHRNEIVLDDIDQRLGLPSIFDADFDPTPVSQTLETIARAAHCRGTRVLFVIPPEAFGCAPIRTFRCATGLILTPADRNAFIRTTLPTMLRRIAGDTGATVADLQAQMRASPDRCDLFAAEQPGMRSDELHTNEVGRMAVALLVADAIASEGLAPLHRGSPVDSALRRRAARRLEHR